MSTGQQSQGRGVNRAHLKQVLYQHRGQQDAISSRDLAHIFGDKPTNVRDAVQDLVRDGALIASCSDGYYRINSVQEVRAEIRSLLDEAETRRERARTLRAEWERLEDELDVPGQQPVKPAGPAVQAAELAVGQDYHRAENALLEALSRVRRLKQTGGASR